METAKPRSKTFRVIPWLAWTLGMLWWLVYLAYFLSIYVIDPIDPVGSVHLRHFLRLFFTGSALFGAFCFLLHKPTFNPTLWRTVAVIAAVFLVEICILLLMRAIDSHSLVTMPRFWEAIVTLGVTILVIPVVWSVWIYGSPDSRMWHSHLKARLATMATEPPRVSDSAPERSSKAAIGSGSAALNRVAVCFFGFAGSIALAGLAYSWVRDSMGVVWLASLALSLLFGAPVLFMLWKRHPLRIANPARLENLYTLSGGSVITSLFLTYWLLSVALAALAAVAMWLTPATGPAQTDWTPIPGVVSVHLVSHQPRAGYVAQKGPVSPGRPKYFREFPMLSGSEIEAVRIGTDLDGNPALSLRFSDRGSDKLMRYTSQYMGEPIVYIREDTVVLWTRLGIMPMRGVIHISGMPVEDMEDVHLLLAAPQIVWDSLHQPMREH
jgi:hypothetical protein